MRRTESDREITVRSRCNCTALGQGRYFGRRGEAPTRKTVTRFVGQDTLCVDIAPPVRTSTFSVSLLLLVSCSRLLCASVFIHVLLPTSEQFTGAKAGRQDLTAKKCPAGGENYRTCRLERQHQHQRNTMSDRRGRQRDGGGSSGGSRKSKKPKVLRCFKILQERRGTASCLPPRAGVCVVLCCVEWFVLPQISCFHRPSARRRVGVPPRWLCV